MNLIKCPVCQSQLHKDSHTYRCENNHSFDIAKQGYCNLLIDQSSKIHGDTKEMLLARKYIQENKYYEKVLNKIIELIDELSPQSILDIGCGIGYYTSNIEQAFESVVIGIDISKEALKIAAKENHNVIYLVASNNTLPIADSSIDLITNIFSPVNEQEVTRVLKSGGYILVVSPNANHLLELKEIIYDKIVKKNVERNDLVNEHLKLTKEENIKVTLEFDQTGLNNLFLMTPHFWTSSLDGKERLKKIHDMSLTIDVQVKVYQYIE